MLSSYNITDGSYTLTARDTFINNMKLFDTMLRISPVKWQEVLENFRLMKSICKRMTLLVMDGLTRETCISIHLFAKQVFRLTKRSGLLFCSLYLKQCSSSLATAYGGVKRAHDLLPVPVSLTRSGYPRLIPKHHRFVMYKHDDRADRMVQFYLSLFSIYRIIEVGKKVNRSTFASIKEPIKDINAVYSFITEIKHQFKGLVKRYIPDIHTIPLNQGMSWVPSWKALPTYSSYHLTLRKFGKGKLSGIRSPFPAQTFELGAFRHLVEFTNAYGEQWNAGTVWFKRTRYAFDPMNKVFSGLDLDYFESKVGPFLPPFDPFCGPVMTGRLGQKVEGGGKRRIFAIGNYVNQRLLYPVHQWIASVLKRIPMDGTFNQTKPLEYLVGQRHCFSYDLKSATDRWPLSFMFEIFQVLFDRSFASAVINSALATNKFYIPFVKRSRNAWISFVAGQPLGYHSSWPLFAFTHHLLVWWCAEQVYPGRRFTSYAVLGDDIVITDAGVAQVYKDSLSRLEVKISEPKSLISDTGCIEFAKRFIVRDASKDISPVSIKAVLNAHHPYGLYAIANKYKIKRLSTFCRLGGAGYRTLASLPQTRSKKWKRYWSMWNKLNLPLDLWLGRGRPLNPYLRGYIIAHLRTVLKPKDLRIPPEELFFTEDQHTFQFFFPGWVSLWLKYVQWYWEVAMSEWVTIEELMDAPVVSSNWKQDKKKI